MPKGDAQAGTAVTSFALTNSVILSCPNSRPKPEFLVPPNGCSACLMGGLWTACRCRSGTRSGVRHRFEFRNGLAGGRINTPVAHGVFPVPLYYNCNVMRSTVSSFVWYRGQHSGVFRNGGQAAPEAPIDRKARCWAIIRHPARQWRSSLIATQMFKRRSYVLWL